MSDPIPFLAAGGVGPVGPGRPGGAAGAPVFGETAAAEKSFRSILMDSLDEVNRLQKEADLGVQDLLTGETDNVADVLNAVNKAGVAFDLLMEVRNKLIDAYREIQEMRV
jgi:flagellar hook-basal body complex protein FliE